MQGTTSVFKAVCCAALLASVAWPQDAERPVTLDALIEHALRNNPDLLAARQRLAEAQGLLRQAGLRPNPSLEVSTANGDMLGSAGERQFEVGYSHTLELGGKRGRRVEAAQLEAELAAADIADRERDAAREGEVALRGGAGGPCAIWDNTERVLALTRKSHELALARVKEAEGAPLRTGATGRGGASHRLRPRAV